MSGRRYHRAFDHIIAPSALLVCFLSACCTGRCNSASFNNDEGATLINGGSFIVYGIVEGVDQDWINYTGEPLVEPYASFSNLGTVSFTNDDALFQADGVRD